VDARGLVGEADVAADKRSISNPRAPSNATRRVEAPNLQQTNLQRTQNTMNALAERTGGRAYMNTNDLQTAIRNSIDDSKVSYVVSYYPSHRAWDGKWHDIKIDCSREGVEMRYGMGYFAFEDRPLTSDTRLAALQQAAQNPLDETAVGLFVRVAPNLPNDGLLRVVTSVAAKDLQLQLKDDKYEGSVELVYIKQPAAGQPSTTEGQNVGLHLTKLQYDEITKEGLLFVRDLKLSEVAYKLKLLARDGTSGHIGSISIRTDKLKPNPPDIN